MKKWVVVFGSFYYTYDYMSRAEGPFDSAEEAEAYAESVKPVDKYESLDYEVVELKPPEVKK